PPTKPLTSPSGKRVDQLDDERSVGWSIRLTAREGETGAHLAEFEFWALNRATHVELWPDRETCHRESRIEPLFTESQLSVNLLPTPASPHNGVHGHGDASYTRDHAPKPDMNEIFTNSLPDYSELVTIASDLGYGDWYTWRLCASESVTDVVGHNSLRINEGSDSVPKLVIILHRVHREAQLHSGIRLLAVLDVHYLQITDALNDLHPFILTPSLLLVSLVMKLFPIAGIVYVAFGFLTTTTNGAPFPSNAIVTERKASEAEALSIADNGVASSLVRRRLSQPHNPTVTHGDSNSNSDSELESELTGLNIDNALGRPTTSPTNSDFRVPEDIFEALVWFSDERPSADSAQLDPVAANVYPDAYRRITSVVTRSGVGIPPCNSIEYLESLAMDHRRFHFQFFRIPHDTGTPVAIRGPFHAELPPLEIPRDRHDLYELQVWFTDTGRQRGPDSEVRLSIRATGLSVRNARHVYNGMSSSMSLAMSRFRIGDSSEVIPVFREKWSEGDRQFHWQVFERDRNSLNLVAMGDNGPFTADLLATDAPPHTGGNSGTA
ncbi:hypothetical protein EV360DRAFT_70455, partial [Lentinula raphanica]